MSEYDIICYSRFVFSHVLIVLRASKATSLLSSLGFKVQRYVLLLSSHNSKPVWAEIAWVTILAAAVDFASGLGSLLQDSTAFKEAAPLPSFPLFQYISIYFILSPYISLYFQIF